MKSETVEIHFFSEVFSCHPEILLLWFCDGTTCPLYRSRTYGDTPIDVTYIAVNAPTKGALVLVTKDWFVSVVC